MSNRLQNALTWLSVAISTLVMVVALLFVLSAEHGGNLRLARQFLICGTIAQVLIWIALIVRDRYIRKTQTTAGMVDQLFNLVQAAARQQAAGSLIENIPDVVCALDRNGKFIQVSPSAKAMWQVEAAELRNRLIMEFVPTSETARVVSSLKSITEQSVSQPIEISMLRKDGTKLDTIWSANYSSKDNLIYCTIHDISAIKQAERLLQQSEYRIRVILEASPIGVLILDGLKITFANPSALNLLGQDSFSDVFEHSLGEFVELSDTFKEPLVNDEIQRAEIMLRGADVVPADLMWRRFTTAEGQRTLVMLTDATPRFELERLRTEFVAMLGHELRTPLTSLQAFLTLVEQGAYGGVSDQLMQRNSRAKDNVSRLIELINCFLDSEKLNAGKLDFEFREIKLREPVESAISSVSEFAEKQKIKLDSRLIDITVMGDTERLTQVLINLLSNALKYSQPGSSIDIAITKKNPGVEIAVTDSGPGIEEEFQEFIFEKYAQIKGKNQRPGTGLGLPLCKAIVEKHGGSIGVRSNPAGKGSCFWFTLPVVTATPLAKEKEHEKEND